MINNELTLVWNEEQSIIKRRSNFHEINLKSWTGPAGDFIKLNSKYTSEASYFPNNDTYDITQHVGGIIIDLFSIFQSELNFTTNYYIRKDSKFGAVIQYSNGTFGGVGMIPDLFHGKAEIINAPLFMSLSRFPYLDYLPAIDFALSKFLEN